MLCNVHTQVALLQQDVVYENRAVIVQNFDILQGCSLY